MDEYEIKPATFCLASGQVFCWGSNQHGQCGRPPDKQTKEHNQQVFTTPQQIGGLLSNIHVTQVKTGWSHLLAITGKRLPRTYSRRCYLVFHANFIKIPLSCILLSTCDNGFCFQKFVNHLFLLVVVIQCTLHTNFCHRHLSLQNPLPCSGNFCCLTRQQ